MKAVILAGGFGTRISEESHLKPKPMIEIGGKPILWHIMKIYSSFGVNDFIVCLGYKGYYIKEYFAHYFLHESDITFDFSDGNRQCIHTQHAEPWKVTLVDTGLRSMTGGRIRRIREYVEGETFMLTYGDGVSDVDLRALLRFHLEHGKIATLTAVLPESRFGALSLNECGEVLGFQEKPKCEGGWINGGFFVLEPEIFDYLKDDATVFEREPLSDLAKDNQLVAYKHRGFWRPMDTLREKMNLEKLWDSGDAPWKLW